MKKVLLLLGLLLALSSTGAYTQTLLEYYDSEIITVNYQTFGGISFVQGGVSYSANFGLEQPLRDMIASNSQTAPLIERHIKNMRTGWIFFFTGLVATTVVTYLAITSPLDTTEEDVALRTGAMIGLGIFGTVSVIAGPLFINAGYSNLFQAVNIYNRDKIRQHRQT
jgi:hypothetical protein